MHHKSNQFFSSSFSGTGISLDNSLGLELAPLEFDIPTIPPKFISRGQSYRAVIGDTIILPCQVQDLGKFFFFVLIFCRILWNFPILKKNCSNHNKTKKKYIFQ